MLYETGPLGNRFGMTSADQLRIYCILVPYPVETRNQNLLVSPLSRFFESASMYRNLAAVIGILVAAQVASAATPKRITVAGQLSGNTRVSAQCIVSSTGQVSGTGSLTGRNPNGTTYGYPFVIKTITTTTNKITLKGNFAVTGSPPITLTAAVPSGAMSFQYVINGRTVNYTGTGTASVR